LEHVVLCSEHAATHIRAVFPEDVVSAIFTGLGTQSRYLPQLRLYQPTIECRFYVPQHIAKDTADGDIREHDSSAAAFPRTFNNDNAEFWVCWEGSIAYGQDPRCVPYEAQIPAVFR
jgi:hypothetical protein